MKKIEKVVEKINEILEQENITTEEGFHVMVSIVKNENESEYASQSGIIAGQPSIIAQGMLRLLNDHPSLKRWFGIVGVAEMINDKKEEERSRWN